ncbi:MAG TPA: Ig-like domain repeat protein, partial [Cellulomonas sp.]|uniref:Ig-like domain repeat protein n=1 Tax=Cellulomonas sp. TaxID=40001 RepID=UPI002E30FD14
VPLPLTFTCFSAAGAALGYFSTPITMTAPDNLTLTSWSVPAPPALGTATAVATSTTLGAAAAGANLALTATVAPSSAAGSVTFKEGTTTLGSAPVSAGVATYTVTAPSIGAHTYSASFVPTDVTTFLASDAPAQSWTVAAGQGGIAVTLTVPAVVQTEPGSLTLSVPSSAAVTLSGARDSGNTRVTATAALPAIKVDDTRRSDLLTGWQVNVQASDFSLAGAPSIGAKYLGWTPAATLTTTVNGSGSLLATQAGPAVSSFLDAATSAGLSTSAVLGSTTTSGQGSTTLGATLNLAIPSSTTQGSYSSTITVTLIAS